MDTPPPTPEQRPTGSLPDQLIRPSAVEQAPQPVAGNETVRAPETGPTGVPSPVPVPAAAPQASGQPLSRDDVAAAIAAVPTPVTPPVPVPTKANDQDVVEPEWVDAAEQTIARTAGNPYAEEEAVEGLQIDYLKKRYGYEVKKPEET